MKKNRIMRVFSVLLALTLISTCAISGTFAKYVTKAEGEDAARVAKWGVLVSVKGNAFDTQYKTHDETYDGEYSVIASNEDQVVAPGTSSTDLDQNLVATVTGKPEVAARYTISGTGLKDVVLPAGEYTDYTELKLIDGEYKYDKFTLDNDYAPIKWNMTISKGNTSYNVADLLYAKLPANLVTVAENYGLTPNGCSFFDAITILQKVASNEQYTQIIEDALGEIVSGGSNFQLTVNKDEGSFEMSYDFEPNKEMGFTFELSWEWAFEGNDKADTFLGNWAAVEQGQTIDGFVEPAAPASCEISANLVATATQID